MNSSCNVKNTVSNSNNVTFVVVVNDKNHADNRAGKCFITLIFKMHYM